MLAVLGGVPSISRTPCHRAPTAADALPANHRDPPQRGFISDGFSAWVYKNRSAHTN